MGRYQERFAALTAELDRRFATLTANLDRRFAALTAELDRRFAALAADLDRRFDAVDIRLAKMDTCFAEMEARFEKSLRVQLATILSAFVGVTGLAVALIKLFP